MQNVERSSNGVNFPFNFYILGSLINRYDALSCNQSDMWTRKAITDDAEKLPLIKLYLVPY